MFTLESHLDFLRHRFKTITDKELIRSLKFEFVFKSIAKDIALDEAKNREIDIKRIDILSTYKDLCNEHDDLFRLFEGVSIRGRVAFGIAYIEKLATKFELKNITVYKLLEILWSYVSSSNLAEWEENIMELTPDLDDYWLFSKKFHFTHLPYNAQFIITIAIMNVIDIGRGNLYSGYRSSDTMMYLLRLIDNMKNNNIESPDPSPFLRSKADEFHGWGNKVKPSFFRL